MSTLTGANLSAIDEILKEDYRGPIVETLNNKTLLLSRIEKTSEYTQGREAVIPLHVGRNEGLGSRGEATDSNQNTLPTAGQQAYEDARYRMRYHYGRIKFTGPAVAAARNNEGAFTRVVDSEVKGLVRDALRDFNRQLFGPSSGNLANIVAVAGAASTSGSGNVSDNAMEVDTKQHLRVGMKIDMIDDLATDVVLADGEGVFITAIAPVAGTSNYVVTFDPSSDYSDSGAQDASDADYLVRSESLGKEMFGLIDLVNNVNPEAAAGLNSGNPAQQYVGGIDRSVTGNEYFEANVIDHNDAQFADTLFQDAIDLVDIEGDGDISIFITTHAIFNAYARGLLTDRRYNTSGSMFERLDGGYDAIMYNGIPVAKDRDCQADTIYGLAEDRLMILEQSDWDWMDKDGSILTRVDNQDAYTATLFKYCQFGISDPKDCVLIKNVAT